MEDWQVGYLAGMIDAEFHVGIDRTMSRHRRTPAYVVRADLAMTDRKPVDFVNSLLPSAKRLAVASKGRRAAYYRLRLTRQDALALLRLVLPYVQGKRRQIEICLEIDALRRALTPSRHHFGSNHFQRLPSEFAEQADVLCREFRALQLNKKPRALAVWDNPVDFERYR